MMTAADNGLADWLREYCGPGKRYPSPFAMSLEVGIGQNQVNTILRRGTARPDTLIKIARAVSMNPVKLFKLAGWLTDLDIEPKLTRNQERWLDLHDQLSAESLEALDVVIQGLLRRDQEQAGVS